MSNDQGAEERGTSPPSSRVHGKAEARFTATTMRYLDTLPAENGFVPGPDLGWHCAVGICSGVAQSIISVWAFGTGLMLPICDGHKRYIQEHGRG